MNNPAAYEKYRTAKIEGGKIYQDFIVDACWNLLGLAIVQYSSAMYQKNVGESKTGARSSTTNSSHAPAT
jgi:hypothetical protein